MKLDAADAIVGALDRAFVASDLITDAGDMVNITEAIHSVGKQTRRLADAITPVDAMPGTDQNGIKIGCLTEAVMSVAAALREIADAIRAHE